MYAFFYGKVENILNDRIILNVNNIGYEIYMPESEILSLEDNKNKVKIYTYLNVREDDMKLFGFTSLETLEFFKKLIRVSGVGPKVALGIISNVNVSDMCVAIATDNIATLKSIPGIGPKMAQKIIFELKDKAVIAKINVDENRTTAARFFVSGIPAMLLFKDGKLVNQTAGVRHINELKKLINNYTEA